MKRIAFVGECMIELFERPGDAPGLLRRTVGGDSLNAAVYCRRALGDKPQAAIDYVTRLGDDPYGAEMPAAIEALGVGASLIEMAAGETTGLYAIHRDAAGERSFAYWRSQSAARRLFATPNADALVEALTAFDGLYFSGITLAVLSPEGRERLLVLARTLKTKGRLVAFDSNYRPRLWQSVEEARAVIAEGYASASLALPTFDDEMLLHGDETVEAVLKRLGALGARRILVKRGGESAILREDGGTVEVPAPTRLDPVDTTAAGDSFNGAVLAAVLSGLSLRQAAVAGHRMAAAVISDFGAIVGKERTWWADGPGAAVAG